MAIPNTMVSLTATHCNTLQHTATHRNTLQHTAPRCRTGSSAGTRRWRCQKLWCHCRPGVLQCVAVCRSVLCSFVGDDVAVNLRGHCRPGVLQRVAVCRSVSQCVAVWCSGLLAKMMPKPTASLSTRCVSVSCSVLQSVVVCRSVL